MKPFEHWRAFVPCMAFMHQFPRLQYFIDLRGNHTWSAERWCIRGEAGGRSNRFLGAMHPSRGLGRGYPTRGVAIVEPLRAVKIMGVMNIMGKLFWGKKKLICETTSPLDEASESKPSSSYECRVWHCLVVNADAKV